MLMPEENNLLTALGVRWRKLRKEWDRTRHQYSEDAVHDLRVASRRLIAVLETLDGIRHRKEIRDCRQRVKNLLDKLSPLRDLQVQRLYISQMAARHPEVEGFEKNLSDKEDRTASKVQRFLKGSPKLGRAIADAERHAAKTVDNDAVRKIIDKRYRKVLTLARRIDPGGTTTIHRMRLAFKQFRYTCEVAQPIIRKELSKDRLKHFHSFQTMMGDIQDIEVLSARLLKWA